jgi:Flp pilus assembly protein TadG
MRRCIRDFSANESGAVAPLIAISLFALIAVGGVAFDYSRLATMDTELQNAADQAALAAATQLDGESGAAARAVAAAQSLLQNQTRMGNDGSGVAIQTGQTTTQGATTTVRVNFYANKADAEADTNSFTATATNADTNAKFVKVDVTARKAYYALTPIVAAFNSGDVGAAATAGLGSAICKVPPLMMCNPDEPSTNSNVDYDFSLTGRTGIGMKLVANGSYAPGNFGFLETGFGNGASALLQALGYNNPPGDCLQADGVTSKTGLDASVMDGINTRFDMPGTNSCPGGGPCSPSINERKDLVRSSGACDWDEPDAQASDMTGPTPPRYRPTSAAALGSGITPTIMGLPRDICHAWSDAGSCTGGASGRLGDGNWDRDAYFRSNHVGVNYATAAGLDANGDGIVTRYETYLWEINTNRLGPSPIGSKSGYGTPQPGMCLYPGQAPGVNTPDRRKISTAVVNCHAESVNGHETDLKVVKWLDLFLVEPSFDRKYCKSGNGCNTQYSDKTDMYVELIGETNTTGAGTTGGQVTRRDVPYLVR